MEIPQFLWSPVPMLYCPHGEKLFFLSLVGISVLSYDCFSSFHCVSAKKKAWHHRIRGLLSLPFSRLKKSTSFNLFSQCKCLSPNHLGGSCSSLSMCVLSWGAQSQMLSVCEVPGREQARGSHIKASHPEGNKILHKENRGLKQRLKNRRGE